MMKLILLTAIVFRASDLLGTISDPQGTAVVGAKVTATETATAVKLSVTTDRQGFYSFQNLSIGHYDVQIDAAGFRPLRRTGVAIDVNSKVVADATLTIGDKIDTVTVSEAAARVETVDTQMGQ